MDHVLKPAATLGTALVCSPEDYTWGFSYSFHPDVEVADAQHFDFIDFNTHCSASEANLCGIQKLTKIGHYVAPIFPGLCREAQNGSVTIQKPLQLVAFKDTPPNPSPPTESMLETSPCKSPQIGQSSGSGGSVPAQPSSPAEDRPRRIGLFRFLD